MSPAQTQLYFRKWNPARVALAAGATSEMAVKVREMADHMAARDARKVDAEVLRHACHVVALGRQKSSKTLTNAELDRVLLVFRLIVNADDLAAVIAWDQPDQGQVKRLTWSIKHVSPEAMTVHVAKDKFGRGDWWNLGVTELRQLLMTLKRIKNNQPRMARIDTDKGELVEGPF